MKKHLTATEKSNGESAVRIRFKNLNLTPHPAWQKKAMAHIDEHWSGKALEASEAFRKSFEEKMPNIAPGYFATAYADLLQRSPRYAYLKNIKGDKGTYEAEIDLIMHEVSFTKIDDDEE